jgi:CBS domain-containing protein
VRTHSRRVADVMTSEPVTVTEQTSLPDAIALLEKHHIKRLPVVRHGALVGLISRFDLVRALGEQLAGEPKAADTSDIAIEGRVHAALVGEPWYIASSITISVEAGVVTFDGVIYDDRVRGALRVAAQNVSGVTDVVNHVVWVDPATATVISGQL